MMRPIGSHDRGRRAMTLMEILVVIAIMVIMAGFLLAVSGSISARARRDRVEVFIQKIESALAQYNGDFGRSWMAAQNPDDPAAKMIPDISAGPPSLDAYRGANKAVAAILRRAEEFSVGEGFGKYAEIVEDPDASGDFYVVDIWYDRHDADHGLDQQMIRLAQGGFNRPELDIWSFGPNGQDDTPEEHDVVTDTYIQTIGDDVANWGTR